jgi:hypothetical protein
MSKHDVAPNTERTCRLCGRTGKQRFHIGAPRAQNPWECDNKARCEIRQGANAARKAATKSRKPKATAPKAKRTTTRKRTSTRK